MMFKLLANLYRAKFLNQRTANSIAGNSGQTEFRTTHTLPLPVLAVRLPEPACGSLGCFPYGTTSNK